MNELLVDATRRSLSEARANNEARRRASREAKAAAEADAARERLTPLDDRLARLLATIPTEVQREWAFARISPGPVAWARTRSLPHWRTGQCASSSRV